MKDLEIILLGTSKNKYESFIPLLISILVGVISNFVNPIVFVFLILFANYLSVRLLIKYKLGLLPCSLFLFIVSPGVIQTVIWYLSQGNISVALLGNDYLNTKTVNFVGIISTISGASSVTGFLLMPAIFKLNFSKINKNDFSILISFVLFMICGILYARSTGESIISTGGYISDSQESKSTSIGTLNVFFFFFFSYFFIFKFWLGKITKYELYFYLTTTIIVVLYIAMRGVRQDSIGFLLALYAIIKSKKYITNEKGVYKFVLTLFFISWIGSVVTGLLRESLTFENLLTIAQNPFALFTIISSNYVVFNMNTASMTIGTLNVLPLKIQDQGYLYGKTFLDWLPRTLPEIIYPDRPIGPEYSMNHNNEWFGWGGIHETSEIYWNFGIIGIIFIPMIISYLINSVGKSFLRSNSPFSAIPIVWLIMMPRWSWYQLFALYKSTFVMIILSFSLISIINRNKAK
jgi:hypothetical protein